MAITKLKCPICSEQWVQKTATRFGKSKFITGVCGHTINETQIVDISAFLPKATKPQVAEAFKLAVWDILEGIELDLNARKRIPENVVSIDGKKLFPFQVEAVKRGEAANFNCLFEYQMGLGKTPITDVSLLLHQEELLPALIVCKGSIKWQHFKEAIRWNGGIVGLEKQNPIEWTAQVIGSSADPIMPIFKLYITSYDMLRRLDVDELKPLRLKTIILDECQHIKNHKSKRSASLRNLIDELGIKHKIALSGTPIKNAPVEFFSILNLLKPEIFYSKKHFESNWVEYRFDRKKNKWVAGGIRNLDRFHEITKDFIFRKTREEVKEEIGLSVTEPFRDFQYIDIDTDIRKNYKETEDEFANFFARHDLDGQAFSFKDYSHILALFSKLRHLTGVSKISWTEEFISEWLSSRCLTVEDLSRNYDLPDTEKLLEPKIAIFTHHIDVAKFIMSCISNICEVENYDWKPLYLPSGLDAGKQDDLQREFNFGPSRVLVASTLGSGEGINLQHNCHDCIMMERQWNPSNEEQAESRFIRIGQKADLVTVTYPVVLGTIDEYFTELVERKRAMIKEIKSGKASQIQWDEQETVMNLARAIIQKRQGKRWTY